MRRRPPKPRPPPPPPPRPPPCPPPPAAASARTRRRWARPCLCARRRLEMRYFTCASTVSTSPTLRSSQGFAQSAAAARSSSSAASGPSRSPGCLGDPEPARVFVARGLAARSLKNSGLYAAPTRLPNASFGGEDASVFVNPRAADAPLDCSETGWRHGSSKARGFTGAPREEIGGIIGRGSRRRRSRSSPRRRPRPGRAPAVRTAPAKTVSRQPYAASAPAAPEAGAPSAARGDDRVWAQLRLRRGRRSGRERPRATPAPPRAVANALGGGANDGGGGGCGSSPYAARASAALRSGSADATLAARRRDVWRWAPEGRSVPPSVPRLPRRSSASSSLSSSSRSSSSRSSSSASSEALEVRSSSESSRRSPSNANRDAPAAASAAASAASARRRLSPPFLSVTRGRPSPRHWMPPASRGVA